MNILNQDGEPRTSVILPVYNGAKTLNRALCSILSQTREIDELVIVNDGSSDSTDEIIDSWVNKLPIVKVTNSPNLGLTQSLRRGVEHASGNLLLRIDADDLWLENHVESIVALKRRSPDAILLAARAEMRAEVGGQRLGESLECDNTNVRRHLLWDNPLVHSAVAIDKSAYNRVGGYTGPTYAEDYDLWIRMLEKGKFECTDKISVVYMVSQTSVSRINRQNALKIRLGLQRKAVSAFGSRHPIAAAKTLAIVWLRQFFNKFGLT